MGSSWSPAATARAFCCCEGGLFGLPGLLPPAAAAAAAAAGPAVAAVVAAMRVQTREMICFGAENVCV